MNVQHRKLIPLILLVAFSTSLSPVFASNLSNAGNTPHQILVVLIHNGQVENPSAVSAKLGLNTITLIPAINGFWKSNSKFTVRQLQGVTFTPTINGITTAGLRPNAAWIGWFGEPIVYPVYSYEIFYVFV